MHPKTTFSFSEYLDHVEKLYGEGRVTGPEQSPGLLHYTGLNLRRMRRILKTTKLIPELEAALADARPQRWLIITEGWCGDAAQNLPVLHMMVDRAPQIDAEVILRDENPEIMDRYLTNGTRSIPIVVVFDAQTEEERAVWGPRPAPLQAQVLADKASGVPHDEYVERAHGWYAKDRTLTLQREFAELLIQN